MPSPIVGLLLCHICDVCVVCYMGGRDVGNACVCVCVSSVNGCVYM